MMNGMDWFNNIFNKKEPKRIFLDYASATPILPEVKKEILSTRFYNTSAIYEEGLAAKKVLEDYRASIARILGAGQKEVVFTSGGTEADNLAILGVFEEAKKTIDKPHIIVSAIEHSAVARAAEECVRRGGELAIVPVNEEGAVDPFVLEKLIKKNTVLVSVGLANSEIGTIQPIPKIGRMVKELRKKNNSIYPLLHTDASAAPSYLNVNIESLQCDLASIDGAKIYGPKGSGALVMRRGVKLHPLIFGGSQEKGLRAGTPNLPAVAGLAKALEIAERDREAETKRLSSLRQKFKFEVFKKLPEAVFNGSPEESLPNILSVSVPGQLGEFLVLKLDQAGVLTSVGTACSLDEKESGSPVVKAIGKEHLMESTVRFSLGRQTTEKDIALAVKTFCLVARNMLK